MWKGWKCKLFINLFTFIEDWISGTQCLYEELGWIFKGKTRWFSLLDDLAEKGVFWLKKNLADIKELLGLGAFPAFTAELPCWKDRLWVTVLAIFAAIIFKQLNVLLSSLQTPPAAVFTLFICGQQALRQKLLVLCGKEDVFSKRRVQNQVSIKIHK